MFSLDLIGTASAVVGVVAAFLLVYRLFDWNDLSYLERALGVALLIVVVGQAYGSSRTIASGVTLHEDVVWAIFTGRLAVVALCLSWPWLRRRILA